jgi:hypothetical protein
MKTLTFTGSANTGFRFMPVTDFTFTGDVQALMDSQTLFRMPRTDGMTGAELLRMLIDKLDQMMQAEVNGNYMEGQHSILVDSIRRTVDLLLLVSNHPNAAWSSREGDDGVTEPAPTV